MPTAKVTSRRIGTCAGLTVLALLCWAFSAALGAGQPTTATAPSALTVSEVLTFDEDERTILEDLTDDDQWDASALYVLLRRAEMLPRGRGTLDQADSPSLGNLWAHPGRYRGQLIRVRARKILDFEDHTETARRTRRWPYPKPVWLAYAEVIVGTGKARQPRPIIVILAGKPPEKLGKNQPVELAGLFYKRITAQQRGQKGQPAKKGLYPIIVARELLAVERPGDAGSTLMMFVMFSLVVALLIGYFFLRRYVGRKTAGSGESPYRPLRFEDAVEDDSRLEDGPQAIDEQLRSQVQAYLNERGASDESDHGQDAQDRG